jgi:hypothetical protein
MLKSTMSEVTGTSERIASPVRCVELTFTLCPAPIGKVSTYGMALLVDRGRMNPLLVREIYAQVEADLKAFKVQFGAKAAR